MSAFSNHSICDTCWQAREGDRQPHRIKERHKQPCCFCGTPHKSGINLRAADSEALACVGHDHD